MPFPHNERILNSIKNLLKTQLFASTRIAILLIAFISITGGLLSAAEIAPVPIAVDHGWRKDPGDPRRVLDGGPAAAHFSLADGWSLGENSSKGQSALVIPNGGRADSATNPLLNRIGWNFTVSLRVRVDALPVGRKTCLVSKRTNGSTATPFVLGVDPHGRFVTESCDGSNWVDFSSEPLVQVGRWHHLALVCRASTELVQYVDGKRVASRPITSGMVENNQPLVIGYDSNSGGVLAGRLGALRVFPVALSDEQLAAEVAGTLRTKPTTAADFPPPLQSVAMHLTRADQPLPDRSRRDDDFDSPCFAPARRQDGPDACDWPQISLDGKPLFANSAIESRHLPLRTNRSPEMTRYFRGPADHVIEPGDHWLRAYEWYWQQRHVYTTDHTAFGFQARYELLTFPVWLDAGGPAISRVRVTYDGRSIYDRSWNEPLRSLTLQLPAVAPGKDYTIQVDERPPVRVSPGLQPINPGTPEWHFRPIAAEIPGQPLIRVGPPPRAAVFHQETEWKADLAEMTKPAEPVKPVAPRPWNARVGLDVPRSGIMTYGSHLLHGMSSNWFGDSSHAPAFVGKPLDYGKHLAAQGFDAVIQRRPTADMPEALAASGVRLGWNPEQLSNPNVAFYTWNLPEYWRPTLRDFQITSQHAARSWPNFLGLQSGADNGGYVPYWDWAGPIMNRPWVRSWLVHNGSDKPFPIGPGISTDWFGWGRKTDQRTFVDHLTAYDRSFGRYGDFDKAVAEAAPGVTYVTGSYGSSPGPGAGGGWPWSSHPGKAMFERQRTLQVYDWNEYPCAKPCHHLAQLDTLRSYFPGKPAWSIVDDFGLFHNRATLARSRALVLTRGINALGTNFLAHPGAKGVSGDSQEAYRELHGWVRAWGGALAHAKPQNVLGILYHQGQSMSRGPLGNDNARGPHEGKVTESLVLSHLAGYPARVVTPEELKRGLPADMKTLLLTGLNRFDESWAWHDGLTPALQVFVDRGGRILLDDESECPVAGEKTGMVVLNYTQQGHFDVMKMLIARNRENVVKLRQVMAPLPRPVVASDEPTVWAVPTKVGDCTWVPVMNWAPPTEAASKETPGLPGNDSIRFLPQQAKLTWNYKGPVWALDTAKPLSKAVRANLATPVDLRNEAVRWFVAAPAVPDALTIALKTGPRGFLIATVTASADETPLAGLPLRLVIIRDGKTTSVMTASGYPAELPICDSDAGASYDIAANELLTGITTHCNWKAPTQPVAKPTSNDPDARFLARRQAVVVALTPAQQNDATIKALGERLVARLRKDGRDARLGLATPDDVVRHLQGVRSALPFPRWQTVEADLILLGTPQDNPLLFDQARAQLIPAQIEKPNIELIHSPFVGGFAVLNLLSESAGLPGLIEGVCK